MKAAYVIAARELRDRNRIFIMAAALAVLPFIIAMLPTSAGDRAGVVSVAAVFLAVGIAYATAIALGSTVLVKEIAERRFSFHLSKPVSASAIWAGKSVAAIMTSVLCFMIVLLPASVVGSTDWRSIWLRDARALSAVVIGIVAMFLISHAAATMIRSRSPLVAVDFVLALGTLFVLYLMAQRLVMGAAVGTATVIGSGVAIVLLVALMVVPVAQISQGRADLRTSHAVLSRSLWITVGIILLTTGAYVAWLSTPGLRAVQLQEISQSPTATSFYGVGNRRGQFTYYAAFLTDTISGESRRIRSVPWSSARWSGDGRVVVWPQEEPGLGPSSMRRELYMSGGGGEAAATGIVLPRRSAMVLSNDGARAAVLSDNTLSIHDLGRKRLLMSARAFNSRRGHSMLFVSPDVVRVYEYDNRAGDSAATIDITEVDVRTRSVTRTGRASLSTGHTNSISVSADGSRMFIRSAGVIADGRSGEMVAKLPVTAPNVVGSAMLADGTVAVVERRDDAPRLHIFTRSGEQIAQTEVPSMGRLWIAAEIARGKLLLVGLPRKTDARAARGMFVIDASTGAIERFVPQVRGPLPRWDSDPRLTRFAEGVQLVALDGNERLITWDPRTGERKPFPM